VQAPRSPLYTTSGSGVALNSRLEAHRGKGFTPEPLDGDDESCRMHVRAGRRSRLHHNAARGKTRVATKLFVGNLDFKTTRGDLEVLLSEIAPPVEVFLPTERGTGRPRGFAFVQFETEDQARQAIARFNNYELGGRPLRVNLAEDRPRPAAPSFGANAGGRTGKPKGSRRNLRARKRSL